MTRKAKILFTAVEFLFLGTVFCYSQNVSIRINSGTTNLTLQNNIEGNLSVLLTQINAANKDAALIDFDGIQISDIARSSLEMLWHNARFSCPEHSIVERLLTTYDNTFQIRNIPILITEGQGVSDDDLYQEAAIDFDKNGVITSFYFGLKSNQYHDVMKNGAAVADLRMRQIILDYVEHFRTAYIQKDIQFLDQVFSDDALIITGKVVRSAVDDLHPFVTEEIQYREYSKKQYLNRLKNHVFPNAKYIHIDFSEVKVSRHPTNNKFYGVRVRQAYDSGFYSDDGYLFMLWDFTDEMRPQIHVRTWQPYWMDEEKTRQIPDNQVIDINSFKGIKSSN